jgi:dihydrolipoamide dehydrogenase
MKKYDLIIIGGGPAGYLAAERAGAGGLNAALFEKRSLGGTCLNEGCIPTKSLLYSGKLYSGALHGAAFGVHTQDIRLDHAEAVARKDEVVRRLVAGVGAKMKAHKVEVYKAAAHITGRTEEGFTVKADGEEYAATNLLIASGSDAVVPPIPGVPEGIESGFVLTSREMLDIKEVPNRLAVIGGGVIGLELADYFRTAGSEVVIVEMLDKIAGTLDGEITEILKAALEAKGIDIRCGSKVTAVTGTGLKVEKDGQTEDIEADKVLLCIGRRASAEGIGLEKLGVLTERGAVVTDDFMMTSVPGVYAAGDVNGRLMLAHTAYREAEVAVANILGTRERMSYDAVPSVIYTYPEVASVGRTEDEARAEGIPVTVKKLPMMYAGRYIAENEKPGSGICKVVIDDARGAVIGIQLIGNYASEIIASAVAVVDSGLPAESVKKFVFPHPTVGEIIKETLNA